MGMRETNIHYLPGDTVQYVHNNYSALPFTGHSRVTLIPFLVTNKSPTITKMLSPSKLVIFLLEVWIIGGSLS